MKKKIRLRNMTYEQYKKWYNTKCSGVECKNCPFNIVNCNEDEDLCWVNNKEMFSDKFLNQGIEIDVKLKLTENDRKLLEFLRDVFKCDRVARNRIIEGIEGITKEGNLKLYINLYKGEENALSNLSSGVEYLIDDLLKEVE